MKYKSFHKETQDEITKTSHKDILEESEEVSENILLEESKDILKEPETHTEFSNKAYVDLMVLVM